MANTPPAALIERCAGAFGRLAARGPRVHAITSPVAAERTANTLLALGCTPTLTVNPDEIDAFVARADAVLVNLGMLDPLRANAATRAFDSARKHQRPVVLDPVFVNLSDNRAAFARDLLSLRPAVFKANGDEAGLAADAPVGTVTVTTGPVDRVEARGLRYSIANGHSSAARVTAMGCALGAVIAACLTVEDDPAIAAATALLAYGIAGEKAGAVAPGPGSFAVAFLDALAALTPTDLVSYGKLA